MPTPFLHVVSHDESEDPSDFDAFYAYSLRNLYEQHEIAKACLGHQHSAIFGRIYFVQMLLLLLTVDREIVHIFLCMYVYI